MGILDIDSLQLGQHDNQTTVTLNLNSSARINYFYLSDPSRFVVDVFGVIRSGRPPKLSYANTPIKKIRSGMRKKDELRIVVELKQPVQGNAYLTPSTGSEDHQLTIALREKHIHDAAHSHDQPETTSHHEADLPTKEKPIKQADAAIRVKNFKKAFRILAPLARQNHPDAQYRLAAFYRYGLGVAHDDKKTYFWMREAARHGHQKAQYSLGTLYLNGRGIEQNLHLARRWFEKAAQQGYQQAIKKLKTLGKAPHDIDLQLHHAVTPKPERRSDDKKNHIKN